MRTATVLRDSYDLNSLTNPGVYSIVSPTNSPGTGNYLIEVIEAKIDGNARQFQIAYPETGGAAHVRAFTGHNGWSSWAGGGGGGGGESTGGDTSTVSQQDLHAISLLAQANGFGVGQRLAIWPGDAYVRDAMPRGPASNSLINSGGFLINGQETAALGTGSRIAATPRIRLSTGGSANGDGYFVDGSYGFTLHRGGGNDYGGFVMTLVFGFDETPTTPILFAGIVDTTSAVTNIGSDPSSVNNLVGVGVDEGETSLQLMHCPLSTGNFTKTDLASELGANQLSAGAMYRLIIACLPGDAGFNVSIDRLDTGDSYLARVTTNIPANDIIMGTQLSFSNGSTNEDVGVCLCAYSNIIPLAPLTP